MFSHCIFVLCLVSATSYESGEMGGNLGEIRLPFQEIEDPVNLQSNINSVLTSILQDNSNRPETTDKNQCVQNILPKLCQEKYSNNPCLQSIKVSYFLKKRIYAHSDSIRHRNGMHFLLSEICCESCLKKDNRQDTRNEEGGDAESDDREDSNDRNERQDIRKEEGGDAESDDREDSNDSNDSNGRQDTHNEEGSDDNNNDQDNVGDKNNDKNKHNFIDTTIDSTPSATGVEEAEAEAYKWWKDFKAAISETDNVILSHRTVMATGVLLLFVVPVAFLCCVWFCCCNTTHRSSRKYSSSRKKERNRTKGGENEEEGLLVSDRAISKPKRKKHRRGSPRTNRGSRENSAIDW